MKGKVLKILAVLGCLTLTAGVVACGGKKDDDKKTSSSESSSFNWWNSSSESSSFNWWTSSSESSSFNWWNSSSESSESSSLSAVESSSNEVSSGESSGANSSSEEILPEEDKITFTTLSVDGNNVYGKVSNETETFAFADEIEVSGNAKYIVSLDEFGVQTVITKTVPLAVGDNVIYIFETVDEEITATYMVTVRRRPIHEVTFNTNGGSPALMQEIEEDDFATEPETTKTGYTFAGWDYDFSQPITESIEIAAQWTANEDTQYTVNYYWQNIADDEYTLHESEALTGTTDTTATATIKQYNHFAYAEEESTISGNIEADGSLTLDVYYTRNVYFVSTTANNTDAGTYTEINAEYRYGQEITLTATPYVGYTCYWYDGETLAGEGKELSCIVEKDVVYTAQFDVAPEMANFDFTPTQDSCVITGMKDKTVTEIVIPDCVTGITEGAFAQCFNVTKLSVSQNVTGIDESTFADCNNLTDVTAPIGIIENIEREKLQSVEITAGETIPASLFENCSDLTKIVIPESVTSIGDRAFKGCNITDVTLPIFAVEYFEKEKLETVVLTSGAAIPNQAFYYCENLIKIVIPDSVTSIGDYAFAYCNSLTEIVIPDSVTSIGEDAFYNCRDLIVYCEAAVKPSGWSEYWGIAEGFVIWDCNNNDVAMDGFVHMIVDGVHYGLKEGVATVISQSRNITVANISAAVTYKGATYPVTSIADKAFYGCYNLTEIVIPNSVTSIGDYASYYCYNLTSVTFGENSQLTSIGEGAFSRCKNLIEIVIPDSVTSIGYGAFYDCGSLTSITVHANNTVYKDIDGNLYTKDGTTLIQYAIGKTATSFTIPVGVTSIGDYSFYNCRNLTSVTFGENSQLTSIGDYAFYNCYNLTEIEIPDSVTSIGNRAFYECEGLTSVTFGENSQLTSIGEDAFFYCSSLTEIVIPNSVTSIGGGAFSDCNNLTSITFGENSQLTSIGYEAFSRCENLTNVTCPTLAIPSFSKSKLQKVVLTSGDRIENNAFANCESLTEITIPDSVTSIGRDAFEGCDRLTIYCEANNKPNDWDWNWNSACCPVVWDCNNNDVADDGYTHMIVDGLRYGIQDGVATVVKQPRNITVANILETVTYKGTAYTVTNIRYYAFAYCNSLTEIEIPDSVTSIGDYAFAYCYNLTEIVIPDSVTSIGDCAFDDCGRLTSITVHANNTVYKDIDGNLYTKDGTTLIQYAIGKTATSFTIPDGVTSIGVHAFYDGHRLMEIVIPDSVTSIGVCAFYSCGSLTSVTFGENSQLTSIGEGAFRYCSNLTEIVIPDSVTSIGDSAFYSCYNLTEIVIHDSVTSIGDEAFYSCANLTEIEIPDSVTSIGNSAFYNCYNLTSITFDGTMEQWNNVTKGYDWNYDVPATEVVCSDGEVELLQE